MKKMSLVLMVCLVLAGGWFWLGHRRAADRPGENEKPVATVGTAVLKRQAIARTLEAFGIVAAAPSGERTIAAPYDCVIRKVHVAAGTPVAADQVLLEVDPSPEAKLALDSARSLSGLATKILAAVQERYDLKLATGQDLLGARQAEAEAQLRVTSLEARGLGGDGQVRAPAAGVIGKLELPAGALVIGGTPLVTVSLQDQLEARLGIEARDLRDISAGQKVVLHSANRGESEEIDSVVRSASGTLDATTGAAEVRVPIPSGAHLLLGEHVVASIEVEKKEDVLIVPRSAVLPDDGTQVLFVVRNGRAVRHEVHSGLANAAEVEVTGEGLHAGDVVVILGNYELEDGMAIQVAEAGGEGKTKPAPEAKP